MAFTVLLCTDGSDLAEAALAAGLAVVRPPDRVVLATVMEPSDPTLVVGTGLAGGVMTADEATTLQTQREASAHDALLATCAALGVTDVETQVLMGDPAGSICDLAASLPATVIVIGTRGRGGIRRAVLGSVSDHVVRNAPCPVVVTGHGG